MGKASGEGAPGRSCPWSHPPQPHRVPKTTGPGVRAPELSYQALRRKDRSQTSPLPTSCLLTLRPPNQS